MQEISRQTASNYLFPGGVSIQLPGSGVCTAQMQVPIVVEVVSLAVLSNGLCGAVDTGCSGGE